MFAIKIVIIRRNFKHKDTKKRSFFRYKDNKRLKSRNKGWFKYIGFGESVMKAIQRGDCRSYWTTTGAYDSVVTYIQMNFDGLKDDIIRMLAGEHVYVDTTEFTNDMHIVRSKNDVLTVLIHRLVDVIKVSSFGSGF